MGKRIVAMVVPVGMAVLLIASSAMAQPYGRGRRNQDDQGRQGQSWQGGPRVSINGQEDSTLSRNAMRGRNDVLLPSSQLFQRLGGQEQHVRGWVPPGSSTPDRDRNSDWAVVRRGDRELRFRAGDRAYYYGGQRRYFSVEPFSRGGFIYIPFGDIIRLFGGSYDWDDRYGYGYATLCDYGYCAASDELRLTYPYNGATYYSDYIRVEGYAAPYSRVRVTIYRDAPYAWTGGIVYDRVVSANRYGLFSLRALVPGDGAYRAAVELLDGYGRVIARDSSRFYER